MININQAEVHMTGSTILQLLQAIDQRKKEPIVKTPMPNGDMTVAQSRKAQYERGIIRVSASVGETYVIDLSNQSESIGYRLERP